jgi:hypothetical protein
MFEATSIAFKVTSSLVVIFFNEELMVRKELTLRESPIITTKLFGEGM